jgi:glutathione-specific gamma-glutamylcyclotransferase
VSDTDLCESFSSQADIPKCYVGRPDNPSFSKNFYIFHSVRYCDIHMCTVGSEQIDKLAEKIWHSVGPSGRNKDYLYELSAAVRQLAPESHDSHLYALEVRYDYTW